MSDQLIRQLGNQAISQSGDQAMAINDNRSGEWAIRQLDV